MFVVSTPRTGGYPIPFDGGGVETWRRNSIDKFVDFSLKLPFDFIPTSQQKWLAEYKARKDSIFQYYNIENEIKFIKEASLVSPEQQKYYLDENVNRFLGEFIGKIPYTTIPYELDRNGFSYAGMHVMDSYKKAAELGTRREKAETVGFQMIEDELAGRSGASDVAYWVSPPKIANYGFLFILKKMGDGKVKEYIFRYDEKMGDLTKSRDIIAQLTNANTAMPVLSDADDFLLAPVFGKSDNSSTEDVDAALQMMHISSEKIRQSHAFENQVNTLLGSWIDEYSRRIIALSHLDPSDPLYNTQVAQTKILLMSIYHQAEGIAQNIKEQDDLQVYKNTSLFLNAALQQDSTSPIAFSENMLAAYAVQMQQSSGPKAEGGSCPAIQNEGANNLFNSAPPFMDNLTMLTSLKNGIPLENKIKDAKDDPNLCRCGAASGAHFHCPGINKKTKEPCGHPIVVGEGITVCPACGAEKTC